MANAEEVKLVLMGAGVAISFMMMIYTVRNRYVDTQKKVKVDLTFQAMLEQNCLTGDCNFREMAFYIEVTNHSKSAVFINAPVVHSPQKIDEYDFFQLTSFTSDANFPFKLESGQSYTGRHSLRGFVEKFKDVVTANEAFTIQVTDSTGKSYKSKKIKFSKFITQLEIEDHMRKNVAL